MGCAIKQYPSTLLAADSFDRERALFMKTIENAAVANAFQTYPPKMRKKLLVLRKLILDTAAITDGVGEIEETLKWGEPSYVTKNKSGSTVRIDWKKSDPDHYAIYFHCQTNLVETFKSMFPNDFKFEGNRALVFSLEDKIPFDSLAMCIAASLTYHLKKRRSVPTTRRSM
ncbi:MAG TPA: DUF1801 domain-containing protein [Burkholderiaceae bacterium]